MEMNILELIKSDGLILIPTIYIIGLFLKNSNLNDRYIPISLLVTSQVLTNLLLGFNIQSIIQAILIAGTAVFLNQIKKQAAK